jgi:hypothetical protein
MSPAQAPFQAQPPPPYAARPPCAEILKLPAHRRQLGRVLNAQKLPARLAAFEGNQELFLLIPKTRADGGDQFLACALEILQRHRLLRHVRECCPNSCRIGLNRGFTSRASEPSWLMR